MKRPLSILLVLMMVLGLLAPAAALAEEILLPDIAAFAGDKLTVGKMTDYEYCIQQTYTGSAENIQTVADAYIRLLKEKYDLLNTFSYTANVDNTYPRYDLAFIAKTAPDGFEVFTMNDSTYGYSANDCHLFICYTQLAGSDENFLQITYSSSFTYADTGDRLSGGSVSTDAPEPVVKATPEPTPNPDCPVCHGDRICDTCGGAGYSLMTLRDSNEPVQIACTAGCHIGVCPQCITVCDICGSDGLCNTCGGLVTDTACTDENCNSGFCAQCMPQPEDRFALVATPEPTPEPTPKPTPKPTEKPEPTRTPKPTPTLVPSGQATFEDGTVIADPALYSDFQFHRTKKELADFGSDESDYYVFKPKSDFEGSLYSFARDYVNALANSRLYEIVGEESADGSSWWYLSYVGDAYLDECEHILLHGADMKVYVNPSDQNINIRLNPDITFLDYD